MGSFASMDPSFEGRAGIDAFKRALVRANSDHSRTLIQAALINNPAGFRLALIEADRTRQAELAPFLNALADSTERSI